MTERALRTTAYGGFKDDVARNYAALPHEYLDEMAELTDEEFGRMTRALLRYSMTGEVAEPVGNERFYIRRVMAQEDRFQASYIELAQKRSEAGKKGMASRWGITSDNKNNKTKTKLNQNYNDSTSSRRKGGKEGAAGAASEERMRKDAEELVQFMEYTKEGEL